MEYTINQLPNAILDLLKDSEDKPVKLKNIYDDITTVCPEFMKSSSYHKEKFSQCVENINKTYDFIHLINYGTEPYLLYTMKTLKEFFKYDNYKFDFESTDHTDNSIINNISHNYYNKLIIDYDNLSQNYEKLKKQYDTIQSESKYEMRIIKSDLEYYKKLNRESTVRLEALENNNVYKRPTTYDFVINELKKSSVLLFLGTCIGYYISSY